MLKTNNVVSLPRTQVLSDLARSGIDADQMKKLEISALTPEQTESLTGRRTPSYRIPYHDVQRRDTGFYRIRFLTTAPTSARTGFERNLKDQRYWQPPGTLPRLYFPRTTGNHFEWRKLAMDTEEPVVITEGEKKAAAACTTGIPTIAMGGVWAWKSAKGGIALIKDFSKLEWTGRRVYVIFDNDLNTNDHVRQASLALCEALVELQAQPSIVQIPFSGTKMGLDDFILLHHKTVRQGGLEALLKLCEVDATSQSNELLKLNDELAIIKDQGCFYALKSRVFYKNNAQVDLVFGDRIIKTFDGGKLKETPATKEWIKWPGRSVYNRIDYLPGQPRDVSIPPATSGEPPGRVLNTWMGLGVEPEEGDVTPFIDLMDYLFEDDCDRAEWMIQWLACPLQTPGTKMLQAILLWSTMQGVGKSLIGNIMCDVYGSNSAVITQGSITSGYNDWIANKQFVLGEEVVGTESYKESDLIKNLITQERVLINKKYQPPYEIRDCANYVFTSNHPNALHLEPGDRRFFVHNVKNEKRSDKFYKRVDQWRREENGPAYLLHYLLTQVDCSKFSPMAPAMATEDREDMIHHGMSNSDMLAADVVGNPEYLLKIGRVIAERDLFTVGELLTLLNNPVFTSPSAFGRSLSKQGCPMRAVRTHSGVMKLYAVRDLTKWRVRQHGAWADHYNASTISDTQKKF